MRAMIALAVLVPLPSFALEFETKGYICPRHWVEVSATYVNTTEGSLVVLDITGRQVPLVQEEMPAASGVRYSSPYNSYNYVWWTKGIEATLLWKAAVAEDEQQLMECAESGG